MLDHHDTVDVHGDGHDAPRFHAIGADDALLEGALDVLVDHSFATSLTCLAFVCVDDGTGTVTLQDGGRKMVVEEHPPKSGGVEAFGFSF